MRQPDAEAARWWFEQTHELVSTGFGAYWRLAWLPHAGSVGEQDAWLWDALRIVKAEQSSELRAQAQGDELTRWRDRRRRDGG